MLRASLRPPRMPPLPIHSMCALPVTCDASRAAACGDTRRPQPPQGMEAQLDAVLCLLGTFSHMTTNDMAAAAFRCAAAHLRPGGLLLLELAHPGAQ